MLLDWCSMTHTKWLEKKTLWRKCHTWSIDPLTIEALINRRDHQRGCVCCNLAGVAIHASNRAHEQQYLQERAYPHLDILQQDVWGQCESGIGRHVLQSRFIIALLICGLDEVFKRHFEQPWTLVSPVTVTSNAKVLEAGKSAMKFRVKNAKNVLELLSLQRPSTTSTAVNGQNERNGKIKLLRPYWFRNRGWEKRNVEGLDEILPIAFACSGGTVDRTLHQEPLLARKCCLWCCLEQPFAHTFDSDQDQCL